MKRKQFTEEQIIGILKEAEAGVVVTELCRKHRMSSATHYAWKAKFGGLGRRTMLLTSCYALTFFLRRGFGSSVVSSGAASLLKSSNRCSTRSRSNLNLPRRYNRSTA